MTSRHNPIYCRECTRRLDAASGAAKSDAGAEDSDLRGPGNGSVSICGYCGTVSLYVVSALGLALRPPTPAELESVLAEHGDLIGALRRAAKERVR